MRTLRWLKRVVKIVTMCYNKSITKFIRKRNKERNFLLITILNEKYSQAVNYANALGGFTGMLNGEPYQIVFAIGHLFEMKPLSEMVPIDEVDNFTTWDSERLPFDRRKIQWGVRLKEDTPTLKYKDRLEKIAASLAQSDTCIIATDSDKSGEGDLLAWEILNALNFRGRVYRSYHENEDADSVKVATLPANLIEVDRNDGALLRGLARQRFDFLSIQHSRVSTDIGRKHQVLSWKQNTREGRLKSNMVELVGSSEYAHETFKPSSRYTTSYVDKDGHVFLKAKSAEFDNQADAEKLVTNMNPSIIVDAGISSSERKPPALPDTDVIAAQLEKVGVDSAEFVKVYAKMYADSIVSYPRTDDSDITLSQLKELIPLVPQMASVIGVDLNDIDVDNFCRDHVTTEHRPHGAIRPGKTVPASLDALRTYGAVAPIIYEAIARAFLAQFAPNAVYQTHRYTDESGEYKYQMTTNVFRGYERILNPKVTAQAILDKNGREIDLELLSDDEHAQLLASQSPVEIGGILNPAVKEKRAKRPNLATQTILSDYLKRNNVGTGATRVKTFLEIVTKDPKKVTKYAIFMDKKGRLRLTDLGKVSFLEMKGTLLSRPDVTKELDKRLDKVADKELTIEDVLTTFDAIFLRDKATIINNAPKLSSLKKVAAPQNPRKKITGTFGPTGKTVTFWDTWSNHTFTPDEQVLLLKGEEISFKLPIDKNKTIADLNGNADEMVIVKGLLRDDGDKYGFGFKQTDRIYPKRTTVTGIYQPTGEEISFAGKFGSHVFTQEEIDQLLAGENIRFTATKRAGGTYTAYGNLQFKEKYGSKTGEKVWQFAFANFDK